MFWKHPIQHPHDNTAALASPERNLPTNLYENSSVRSFWRKCQSDLDLLQRTGSDLAQLTSDYRSQIYRIAGDVNLSAAGKAQRQADTGNNALAVLDQAYEAFTRAQSNIETACSQALELPTPDDSDVQKALLQELRIQAAWNRTVRQLESAGDRWYLSLERIARDVVARRDMDTHLALLRELPGFEASRPDTDGMCSIYAKATDSLLSDTQRAARILASVADHGQQCLTYAFDTVRAEIGGKGGMVSDILGYFGETYKPANVPLEAVRGNAVESYQTILAGQVSR